MTNIFNGLFDNQTITVISVNQFLLCIGVALILGLVIAVCAKFKTEYSKSLLISLAILPAIVCMVIMMVNGNVGAGVAIAGAFALVRFRSSPGDAKQIALVFLTMTTGLITGMGYLAYAVLFTVIICVMFLVYTAIADNKQDFTIRILNITIPENTDYTEIFNDTFEQYTNFHKIISVKTTNMGSLYKLSYEIKIKNINEEKQFIDALRCKNGNLEISLLPKATSNNEL